MGKRDKFSGLGFIANQNNCSDFCSYKLLRELPAVQGALPWLDVIRVAKSSIVGPSLRFHLTM